MWVLSLLPLWRCLVTSLEWGCLVCCGWCGVVDGGAAEPGGVYIGIYVLCEEGRWLGHGCGAGTVVGRMTGGVPGLVPCIGVYMRS